MTDITIPPEALEAAARAIYGILEGPVANQDFSRQKRQWEQAQELARAACLAMLRAWPGVSTGYDTRTFEDHIILPLDNTNAEA